MNTDTDVHLGYLARLSCQLSCQVSLAQVQAGLLLPEPRRSAWLHRATPTGAVGILSHDQSMWWTPARRPEYDALICPLPGPDGKPHFLIDMRTLIEMRQEKRGRSLADRTNHGHGAIRSL